MSLAQVLYVSINGCRCVECFSVPDEDLFEGFDILELRQLGIHVNFVASSNQCSSAMNQLVIISLSCVWRQEMNIPSIREQLFLEIRRLQKKCQYILFTRRS